MAGRTEYSEVRDLEFHRHSPPNARLRVLESLSGLSWDKDGGGQRLRLGLRVCRARKQNNWAEALQILTADSVGSQGWNPRQGTRNAVKGEH